MICDQAAISALAAARKRSHNNNDPRNPNLIHEFNFPLIGDEVMTGTRESATSDPLCAA